MEIHCRNSHNLWLLTILLILSSCAEQQTTFDNSIEYLAFQSRKDGKWGMIGVDGKVLFADKFPDRPEAGRNGMFIYNNYNINKVNYCEIYRSDSVPRRIGRRYKDTSDTFIDGRAIVEDANSHLYFIDKDGNKLMPLDSVNGEKVNLALMVSDGFTAVRTKSGVGMIDLDGNVVIKPYYDNIGYYDGIFVAEIDEFTRSGHRYTTHEDDENPPQNNIFTTVLDKTGKVLFHTARGVTLSTFNGGYAIASIYNDSCKKRPYATGVIRTDGKWSMKPNTNIQGYDYYGVINDKFIFYENEKAGLMDVHGHIILPAKYEMLQRASADRLYEVKSNDDMGFVARLMDLKGHYKGKMKLYGYGHFFKDYAFVAKGDHNWTLIDKEGREMTAHPKIYDIETLFLPPHAVIVENR